MREPIGSAVTPRRSRRGSRRSRGVRVPRRFACCSRLAMVVPAEASSRSVISSGGRRRSKPPRRPSSIATVMGTVARMPAPIPLARPVGFIAQRCRALQAHQHVDQDGEKYRGNDREQNHCETTSAAAEWSHLHVSPTPHCRGVLRVDRCLLSLASPGAWVPKPVGPARTPEAPDRVIEEPSCPCDRVLAERPHERGSSSATARPAPPVQTLSWS